ncbi:Protein of unknown function [Pyronema omphalodes CBS 100304]|uniref:Uncharacterized protein n=1 Tax=Pyronema omphalodes (strain CBS 100304) TaxID=1076935 RepID=U4LQN6_PYROM|nr:Protein of unknown function [Pyronema omphalodes CBS 100304]
MRLEREKLKDVMKLARESGDKLKNMKEIRRNVLEEQIKPWGVDHPNTIDIRRAVVGILNALELGKKVYDERHDVNLSMISELAKMLRGLERDREAMEFESMHRVLSGANMIDQANT